MTRLSGIRAKTIAEAKRELYRQVVDDTTQAEGLWRLSQWSKGTGGGLPQVPTLRSGDQLAIDHKAKVGLLKERFYLVTIADLLDIPSQTNKLAFIADQTTTLDEVTATLASCLSNSALGNNKILF